MARKHYVRLPGLFLVVDRNKLLVKHAARAARYLTIFTEPRRLGRRVAFTPHVTNALRARRKEFFGFIDVDALQRAFRGFRQDLIQHWQEAMTLVSLEELERDGWLVMRAREDRLGDFFDSMRNKDGSFEVGKTVFGRIQSLMEYGINPTTLKLAPQPPLGIERVGPDGNPERLLLCCARDGWYTVPYDWFDEQAGIRSFARNVPPGFWRGLRRVLVLLGVDDMSGFDEFLREMAAARDTEDFHA